MEPWICSVCKARAKTMTWRGTFCDPCFMVVYPDHSYTEELHRRTEPPEPAHSPQAQRDMPDGTAPDSADRLGKLEVE